METKKRTPYLLIGALFYLVIPFLYLFLADFPERTTLKDGISFLTIGAFFLMLGQFYLTRINKVTLKGNKFTKVIGKHKVIGYVFIPVLMLHPFLVVVPRYFEAGVTPYDAFMTMITTFQSSGIIIGLIAMALMVLLGITSMLRKRMKISYRAWRLSHGLLSIIFVILATWHAIDLGRHTDVIMSTYMIIMAATGIFFLLRLYFLQPQLKGGNNE